MSNNNCKPKTPRKPKIYTVKTLDTRTHGFNVGIAMDYSPDMAIWLGHLAFWAEKNLAHGKNIYEGLVWCYDTLDTLCEYFPYYTRRQLETIINNSVKEGLVIQGNYNQTAYDRTNWYALTPKAYFYFRHLLSTKNKKKLSASISQICEMEKTDLWNGFFRSVTTIPDPDPDTDPSMCVGKSQKPTHTNNPKEKKPSSQESVFNCESMKKYFNTKFAGRKITYEDLFQDCKNHYQEKNQSVTLKRWNLWIEREKIDNYEKISLPKPILVSSDEELKKRNEAQEKMHWEKLEKLKQEAEARKQKAKDANSCQPTQSNNANLNYSV